MSDDRAIDKVKCEMGGKHHPQTIERITIDKVHIKVPMCRKCGKII